MATIFMESFGKSISRKEKILNVVIFTKSNSTIEIHNKLSGENVVYLVIFANLFLSCKNGFSKNL